VKRYEIKGAGQAAAMAATGAACNVYNHWSAGRWYELPLLQYWQQLTAPDVYVDVGAHAGNHTVWAGKAWPKTRIVAFEPDPTTWRRLVTNVKTNGVHTADCRNTAAWTKSGETLLLHWYDTVDEGCKRISLFDGTPVRSDSIDEALGVVFGKRVVIKVDTEGEVAPVLHGAKRTLRDNFCHLFLEADDEPAIARLDSTLAALGYRRTGKRWGSTLLHEAIRGRDD